MVKREGVLREDAVGDREGDTEELEDTEMDAVTEGDTEAEGELEASPEKEGEGLEEKQPEDDPDTVALPDAENTPLLVSTTEGVTELLAECVELALNVGDTDTVAESVAVWQGLPESVHAGDCEELCESEREPV